MSSDDDTQLATAGIVLVRSCGGEFEVLVARRPPDRGFLPGFHGFVVGGLREADRDVPLTPEGPYRVPCSAHWGGAARELFEETGLLPLREGWVRSWEEESSPPGPEQGWGKWRRQVRDGEANFGTMLRRLGFAVDASLFHPVGAWTTPAWADLETATEFFVIEAPPVDDDALLQAVDVLEHRDPQWVEVGEAVERWRQGKWFLSTPIRLVLEGLSEIKKVGDRQLLPAAEKQRGVAREMIELVEGLRMLPLSTPTLPPATHTNAYIVGRTSAVLVDPGSDIPRQQALLEEALVELGERGVPLRAVVLTHHHSDHIEGLRAVVERFQPEVLAHPKTVAQLPEPLQVDRMLDDGDVIDVGQGAEHRLRVYHTPGHASGHLCLWHSDSRSLIAGDLVASRGTILIDPPDGHMGSYLESLERMNELELAAILPAHGTVIADPHRHLDDYLTHRREREEKVVEALEERQEAARPRDLLEEVYADAPRTVWPLAVRSLHAHLVHLVERGCAMRTEQGFVYESSSLSTKS